MKTTQKKAINAYRTIAKLSQQPMNSFTAYKMFKLKKALNDPFEFVSEQEKKFVDEIGGVINDEGRIVFKTVEDSEQYLKKRSELDETECDVNIKKTAFTLNELPDLSVADMESLDEFVEWEE